MDICIVDALWERIQKVVPVLLYLKLGVKAPNGLSMDAEAIGYPHTVPEIITVTVWDDTGKWELGDEGLTFSFTRDDLEKAENLSLA